MEKEYNETSCLWKNKEHKLVVKQARNISVKGKEYFMAMDVGGIKNMIEEGKAVLGIEFGSTRIKAVLTGVQNEPVAAGSYSWENRLEDGVWTYSLEDIRSGLQGCYQDLKDDVKNRYNTKITNLAGMGFSGMMHGYMPFDQNNQLLVPFRTWRNTMTEQASKELTELFQFHIPQRWSIAHLWQAVLNGEEHVEQISYLTTLAGYVHWMLSGEKVLGVGEASGMFPIDVHTGSYDQKMLEQFDALLKNKGISLRIEDVLPQVLSAGKCAGTLTESGARFLDPQGDLVAGIPMCPPEGDAGTGMTATNSVAPRTGNVSAGTSVFAMVVLEKELKKVHPEIDLVTTPTGHLVAMVHCNNCTSDLNAWVNIFKEYSELMGYPADINQIYTKLYEKAWQGDPDCSGMMAYCYHSGEHITGVEEGRPLFMRTPDSTFNLANFMRTHLMTTMGALKTGMDVLLEEEAIKIDHIMGHGGLFKTREVGQKLVASALKVPVCVLKTAGEGGAWGIALLAAYMCDCESRKNGTASENAAPEEKLEEFLAKKVFTDGEAITVEPDSRDVAGFETFMRQYRAGMAVEKAAIEALQE